MDKDIIIDQIGITEAMILVDRFIWCVAGGFNAFFRIDIISGMVNYMGEIPGEEFQKTRLYSDIQQYEEKLIFVPMAANEIAVYDIKNNQFLKIKLKDQADTKNLYKKDYKFCKCIVHKSYAYFFNVSFPAIARLDLKNYEMQYLDDWKIFFENKAIKSDKVYFRNVFEKEGRVYLASCCDNQVVEFEIETEKFYCHEIGKEGECFSDIVFCENRIYISKLDSSEILILNSKNWNEIGRCNAGTDISVSILMKEYHNKIFYFPVNMREILIIEDGNRVRRYDLTTNLESNIVYKVISNRSICYYITEKTLHLVVFSMETEEIEEKELIIDNEIKNKIVKKIILKNTVINEKNLNIESWIFNIRRNKRNEHHTMKNNTGNKIWNCMKEG